MNHNALPRTWNHRVIGQGTVKSCTVEIGEAMESIVILLLDPRVSSVCDLYLLTLVLEKVFEISPDR